MFPAKPLICGVAAVGSVSTAAVVANQYGLFSGNHEQSVFGERTETGSNTNASSDGAAIPVAPQDPALPPAPALDSKTNKEKITEWLNNNKGSAWKIQIKKEGLQNPIDFNSVTGDNDSDLEGLSDYLNSSKQKDLLTSLFTNIETHTLTFEKTSGNWKYLLTKEQIDAWVKGVSSDVIALKIAESNTEKTNFTNDESTVIFKAIYDDYSKFSTNLSTASTENKKTILFEKVENDWKHSKTEITKWLSEDGQNKFTLQIKKDNSQELNKINESELIGLLDYLKKEKNNLLKLGKSDSTKTTLTLEKGTGWSVVHSNDTVTNWIDNASSKHAKLSLQDNDQDVSSATSNDWNKIFEGISAEEKVFSDLKSKTEKTTVVFIKDDNKWKHIKKAIKDWLESEQRGNKKLTVQIKNGATTSLDDAKDVDLTGLLGHLKTSFSSYTSTAQDGSTTTVILEKTSGNWTKVDS